MGQLPETTVRSGHFPPLSIVGDDRRKWDAMSAQSNGLRCHPREQVPARVITAREFPMSSDTGVLPLILRAAAPVNMQGVIACFDC